MHVSQLLTVVPPCPWTQQSRWQAPAESPEWMTDFERAFSLETRNMLMRTWPASGSASGGLPPSFKTLAASIPGCPEELATWRGDDPTLLVDVCTAMACAQAGFLIWKDKGGCPPQVNSRVALVHSPPPHSLSLSFSHSPPFPTRTLSLSHTHSLSLVVQGAQATQEELRACRDLWNSPTWTHSTGCRSRRGSRRRSKEGKPCPPSRGRHSFVPLGELTHTLTW